MTQRDDVQKFEQGRIKALQEERLHIQKKTFTKWMNSFLQKARMEVEDLFVDLADGKKLLKLLEIISGEKLGKPNNGKMRVHKIENVNKSLAFLHTKVRLESIGAEDIVDGNPRLILGLIWTIILRFQIQEIEIDVDEENESSEKKSAKDALLLWCQRKTQGYSNVHINDFTTSWRSGLGFNALIHAHRPDLFAWSSLTPHKHIDNLNHAFDVANDELGIPKLLDAEDVDTSRPDEKSVITYVASYYHTFARMKNEMKSGRRIANIIGQMMDADRMKNHYENLTTDLLEWIRAKIIELQDRNFPNSLEGIQSLLLAFGHYRTQEKPPKYKERSEIEALYFNINTQLKGLQQPMYYPPDGQLVQDIERAWERLQKAEHEREVALRSELRRQERLEQLNYKFERKSVLREGYLKEMIQVLSDPRYGSNWSQVDATVKKHEAISADIISREERFHDLTAMCAELVNERYHGADKVQQRESEVLARWYELLELLAKLKVNLNSLGNLMNLLREIDTTLNAINELQMLFASADVGPHLMAVEDLIQKHALQELQVTALGETKRKLQRQGQAQLQQQETLQPALQQRLQQRLQVLEQAYEALQRASEERRARLEEARNFFQFLQDQEDEEAWLIEKQRICQADISVKDLRAVLSLQQKHKALEDEMKARKPKCDQLCLAGKTLIKEKHPRAAEIQPHIDAIEQQWQKLAELAAKRAKQLEDAAEAYQFYADANEAESWLNEKMALVNSSDYGVDEPSAQALLQRHKDLQGELNAYNGDIHSLNQQADRLIAAGISTLDLASENDAVLTDVEEEEWIPEAQLVPTEVWEDVPVERIEHRTVLEERSVPQVKALYQFSGQGMLMAKGEIMFLLNKTNPDWWSVRKADGSDGFVPANYVREIEPRIIQIQARRPEKVRTIQRVKKTKMVKQMVPVRHVRIVKKPRTASKRKASLKPDDGVEKRMKKINDTYKELQELAARRHALLDDSIRLFGFYKECDDFEKWIKDKEKLLQTDDCNDNVEVAKSKFEKFLTDLSASNKRIEALDAAVDEFVRQGHSQLDKVRGRQRHIHQLWDHLNRLKVQKERSLEGAFSVELFNRTCDEARDWMLEKMTQLDTVEVGPDLKTVQALQRRHQNLERELAPVQEKVNRVNLLANTVQSAHPHEKPNVLERQKQIKDLWQRVKDSARDRRLRLEDAVGQQIFMNSSKNLLNWAATVREQLAQDINAKDVATAEKLKKNHQELGDDIKAHEDEFEEVKELGQKLLKRNPERVEISERLDRLSGEYNTLLNAWIEKEAMIKQCVELQMFNREADQIEATTSSHEAFLEYGELGGSLDDVEALMKRHDDFINTLIAQDERVKQFSEQADRLITADHYDKKNINDRRNQVVARRMSVKNLAQQRRNALLASQQFQEFSAEVDDLKGWLNDKLKTASDESYRDLSNLERKLQKHEAFESELRANEGQLRTVNKMGQALIAQNNYRKNDVENKIKDLNNKWAQLVDLSLDKGRRLRQATSQHTYNSAVEDAKRKLEELSMNLRSTQVGTDLRSCKDLLKKHQALEMEISQTNLRVADLVAQSLEMEQEGHFDSDSIKRSAEMCQKQLDALYEPAKLRREALEESLRFHKFGFELDAELQWIKEHMPQATSETFGQNLHQAQLLHKKYKKLEAEIVGHQPMIDKTLASGQNLIEQNHPEKKKVESLCNALQDSWSDLQSKAHKRSQKLDLSLKAQQYFFEAGEVESWLNERNDVLASTDYGRDRDAATKLLTKHKAIELELDTYNAIVIEMGRGAQAMITAQHPDSKAIQAKQQLLTQQMRTLQKLAAQRQQRLMESMYRHEYFAESAELERWIGEQQQAASSEDYGQDYEHLLILQEKFDDFKRRIDAGSERYNQCEELAKKLISNESPYAKDIENKQEQLSKSWNQLIEQIKQRELKLHAAGEIHQFHRDVAEALSRIHEKDAALGDDLGRDLKQAQSLLRRHEGFENDLVALEAQLQLLVEDASRIQAQYPNNAAQIRQQQEIVVNAWNDLEKRSSFRREQLLANKELQQFITQVRDLLSWASSLRSSLSTEEKVRDLVTAHALRAEHEQIKNEIEARDDKFKDVYELGEAMIQTDHYAAQEAEEKCNQLIEERDKLHTAWNLKRNLLDQQIDLHCFLKDAKQLENISSQQEAALGSVDFSGSVDEVDSQVKKHEAFEKKLSAQDDKLINLQECAAKLIAQNHYESPLIQSRLADVLERRQRVKDLCNLRRQKLEDALLYAQFKRDVAEAESLIGEKSKKLQAEANIGDKNNLEDKIKRLQKHQAFQAELSANEGRIQEIKAKGEMLLQKRHEASAEIREQMKNLLTAWRQLLLDSANRGKGLEEAQDILEFNNQLEKIDAWIRDKEMMIQANEKGKDYEHCMALQRKLDDVDSDMRVDDARIKTINQLADKLIKQGQTDAISVQQRRDAFINKWRNLQGALSNYRNTLSGALEVHLFKRDVDDTLQRLSEKAVAINTDDVGRDLTAVQSAQRKQETLERDMSAIEKKVEEHNLDGQKLVKKYPEDKEAIERKLLELSDSWFNLQELSRKRKDLLHDAYENHKFLTELRELDIWVGDCVKRMNATETPISVNDANSQMELHKERKAEIDGRQKVFAALEIEGEKLCKKSSKPKDVNQHVTKLKDLQENLNQAWEDKKNHLTRSYQLQCFKEQADIIDAWLATKEAYLNNEDLGESTSAVEDLLRKHEDFESMLTAQWSKVTELEKFAEEIMLGHDENAAIKQRLQSVLSRTNRLKEASEARKQKLLESQQLHKFLRNVYEVESWLSQKMQVACDENYREPINLQSKIQKHAAFDSEIHANKSRIESVVKEGEELIKAQHFAGEEIESQVDYLRNEWKQLLEMSQLKRDRLNDSYHALLFSRSVDEFETWMSEIESQLKSQDLGKDLASVTNLIKRHTVLENDYVQHSENCDIISETSTQFVQNDHFMKDEIVERATTVIKRYNSLQEPMYARHENLENSLLLHQFLRDAEDEVQWLMEREPHAGSQELGNSLTAVQSLQKKHQALEAELVSHEPIVSGLVSRAQQFSRQGHFASQQIETKGKELQELLAHVRDMASVRRLRLQDALESQTFYTEASEAVTWLKDKRPLIASKDYGKDEDSVQTLQRRLEGLACEMAAFQSTVAKLSKIAANLIERQHFDALNIEAKQSEIELQFSELQRLMTQRENRLSEALKYFAFIRECDEVQEWMGEQTTIAASEDYGTDVEHIELLIQAFESFSAGLSSSEQRIIACVESGQSLLKEENPEELKIKQKIEDIKQQWDDLQELAHARQEALAGAKQVHVFDRTADETIQWIQEKESSLAADYGQDLESIQAQTRRHEAFQTELIAVRDQVFAVDQEAKRLSATFPDAREHIEVKQEDTLQAWNELYDKAEQRAENLKQAEQLQTYFDQYRDLMAWINEMLAKITTPELAQDVPGAESLILHHNEHKAEIDARNDAFTKFYQTGSALVDDKHFLANDIEDKINILKQRKALLEQTWSNRKQIYIENLDTQEFKRDADALENWLSIRENILNDGKFGDTIIQVEELIRKHEDFEKTVIAQEEKFHSIRRITLLEQSFKKQKEMEQAAKQAEKERIEHERIEQRKRQEMQRLTDQRRQETDRRRVVSEIRDDHPRDQPPPPPAGAVSVGNMANRTGSNSSLTKSNSIAFMFDRNRRGSDHNSGVKRAESVKAATKTPKRTPSFTTRRRAGSFRRANDETGLPPVDIQGFLERKHALISGGKKAQVRSWKNVYSVLCGQLLCFFKNKDDFIDSKAAMPPVVIYNAKCSVADDYTKRKHTFRISCADGSEYLFSASNDKEMEEWMNKISFHAKLEPSQQLLSYDTHKLQKTYENNHEFDASSASSRTSSPDSQIRMSPVVAAPGGPTHHPHQPQYLQQQHHPHHPITEQQQVTRPPIKHPEEAPPIPPRAPVVPNRSSVDNVDFVQLRHPSAGSTYDVPPAQQNGAGQQWRHTQNATVIDYQVPPLPDTAPPMDNNRHTLSSGGPKWYHDSFESTGSSDSHYQTQGNYQAPAARSENYSRPVSMPAEYRSASVSSTESEHQSSTQPKKNRMLSGIFSRKKKTTSQM